MNNPKVLAYDDGWHLRIRCPWCDAEHIHGRGGPAPEVATWRERNRLGPKLGEVPESMYGSRSSHCRGFFPDYILVRPPEGHRVDQAVWPKPKKAKRT